MAAGQSAAIRAGAAFVELFTKDIGLVKGLDAAKKRVEVFGKTMAAISGKLATAGAAMALPLVAAFKKMTGAGSELLDLARSSSTSVEALSELSYAAKASGASFEDLVAAQAHLNGQLSDLRDGSKEVAIEFARLGINAQDLMNLPLDKQLAMIADALDKVPDKADRAKAGAIGLGGAFEKLQDLLAGGSAGLQSRINQAIASGATITSEQARHAKQAELIFSQAWTAMRDVVIGVGLALLPAGETMDSVSDKITKLTKLAKDWIAENSGLIKGAAALAAGLLVLAAAFVVGAKIAVVASAGIGLFTSAVSLALGAVSILLTPMGLLTAGIGVAVVAFGNLRQIAVDVLNKVGNTFATTFRNMREVFKTAWGGILDALQEKDLEGAMEIVWLTLKAGFAEVASGATKVWVDVQEAFVKGWYTAIDSVLVRFRFMTARLIAEDSKSYLGAGAGAAGGAAIGTAIVPGVGTLIGAILGTGIGAAIENNIKDNMSKDELLKQLDQMEREELAKISSSAKDKVKALKEVNKKAVAEAEAAANTARGILDARVQWQQLGKQAREAVPAGLLGGGLLIAAQQAIEESMQQIVAPGFIAGSAGLAGLKDTPKPVHESPGDPPKKVPAFDLGAASKGAFQGPFAAMLGYGDSVARRSLVVQEETAKNTKKLVDLVAGGALGSVFKFK